MLIGSAPTFSDAITDGAPIFARRLTVMLFENAAKIACVTIPNGLRNMLDGIGSTLRTYIVLPEKDYPEYTFTGSSNATIPAFYQKYLRRKATVIR